MWISHIWLGVAISTMVCAHAEADDGCPNVLTLKALLIDAKTYHRRKVCVAGILNVEFEGNALIWDRKHIWLQFYRGPPWTEEGIDRDERRMNDWKRQYQGKCVVVAGTYDITDTGHLGTSPDGGLEDILSISKSAMHCPKRARAP